MLIVVNETVNRWMAVETLWLRLDVKYRYERGNNVSDTEKFKPFANVTAETSYFEW